MEVPAHGRRFRQPGRQSYEGRGRVCELSSFYFPSSLDIPCWILDVRTPKISLPPAPRPRNFPQSFRRAPEGTHTFQHPIANKELPMWKFLHMVDVFDSHDANRTARVARLCFRKSAQMRRARPSSLNLFDPQPFKRIDNLHPHPLKSYF